MRESFGRHQKVANPTQKQRRSRNHLNKNDNKGGGSGSEMIMKVHLKRKEKKKKSKNTEWFNGWLWRNARKAHFVDGKVSIFQFLAFHSHDNSCFAISETKKKEVKERCLLTCDQVGCFDVSNQNQTRRLVFQNDSVFFTHEGFRN
jgi:hypothetical protein